ncbi:hypothetical protein Llon_2047 [Legionella londiniensis]|uniref:Uncharacterized protein n=1 Tax=Legionella londiniensis TaxID=45068 RepID=A0A0W0VIE6_9GAMM|nr:hypothetical protein Llon_2047 [Legionella londiniensis]
MKNPPYTLRENSGTLQLLLKNKNTVYIIGAIVLLIEHILPGTDWRLPGCYSTHAIEVASAAAGQDKT